MEWILIVFVPLTTIAGLALIGHAIHMRTMVDVPPAPDFASLDRYAPQSRESGQRTLNEMLEPRLTNDNPTQR